MNKILFFSLIMVISISSSGQRDNPVTWEFYNGKVANNLYEIDCKAIIEDGWYIYPLKMRVDEIGMPTTILFTANPYTKIIDTIAEKGSLITHYNEGLKITQRYYEKQVIFSQYFSFKAGVRITTIRGTIQYQACKENIYMALESKQFQITIKKE